MSAKQRRAMLFLALAGVVAWSAWLAVNDPATVGDTTDLVEPVTRPSANLARAPKETTKAPQEAQPRLALTRTNLFPEQTWFIPPPPPPPPPYVPPPPPQAPMLPFSYLGSWQEAGQTTYYLMRGSLPVRVRPNQVLDGVWRLEPVRGNVLNFTYLPLNQTRSLRTGE